MLYVTTRNHRDTYTAQRALGLIPGPEGGLFMPLKVTPYSWEELLMMAEQSMNQRIAAVLNRLFGTRLSSWDVDFAAGRHGVRMVFISHRIIMGESWHNPKWDFSYLVRSLSGVVRGGSQEPAGPWLETGVRIAVLFGIFGELIRREIARPDRPVDVSVVAGDFSAPMSARYARSMGLPIGNIILCFNENSSVWDLLHHGELRTDVVSIPTETPQADVTVPAQLEMLISEACGPGEVTRFLDACRRGAMYCPDSAHLRAMQQGLYVSAVSSRRMKSTIPTVYGTGSYLLSPYTALAYAGLLDYRAQTGESRYGLVLAERSPALDLQTVAGTLNITTAELEDYINKQ